MRIFHVKLCLLVLQRARIDSRPSHRLSPRDVAEKTKMAQAVVSQVDTRTGAALRAPTYSRSRSRSPSLVPFGINVTPA